MWYCYNCNRVITELKMVPESRGEYWGVPCYENMWYCSECGSDEVEEITDREKYEAISDICLIHAVDFDEALEIYENEQED